MSWPQPDPYEAYVLLIGLLSSHKSRKLYFRMEKAHATGDELAMDENTRRYFEQQFTDGPDS